MPILFRQVNPRQKTWSFRRKPPLQCNESGHELICMLTFRSSLGEISEFNAISAPTISGLRFRVSLDAFKLAFTQSQARNQSTKIHLLSREHVDAWPYPCLFKEGDPSNTPAASGIFSRLFHLQDPEGTHRNYAGPPSQLQVGNSRTDAEPR